MNPQIVEHHIVYNQKIPFYSHYFVIAFYGLATVAPTFFSSNKKMWLLGKLPQQMHELYYKKIAAEILNYEHVLLFGPTNAKVELHNYLDKDLHFKDIKIDIESTDNITDNEKHAFVKNHFDL